MDITIICRKPGMRRNGVSHTASATYSADHWSEKQIKTFVADPEFEVVFGDESGERHVIDRPLAIKSAVASVGKESLNKDGRPKVAVLEKMLGFKPTPEEIDAAMANLKPADTKE